MIGSSPPSPSDHRYKGQRHGLRKFLEDFVRWAKANRPVLSPGSGLLATQTADGLVMRVVPAAGLPKRGMLPVGGIAAGATGTVTLDAGSVDVEALNGWDTAAPASTKCMVGLVEGADGVRLEVIVWDCP